MDELTHEELARLREKDLTLQEMLAPMEHRAFAREWVRENPLAVLSLTSAIPAYQLAKLLKLGGKGATPASLDQLFAGYTGMIEGLK